MNERDALRMLTSVVARAGDDAAVIDGDILTIDMLHESTDFPTGTTRYTTGWRSVGASLSDIAAMGGDPIAAVAVYGAPEFDDEAIREFVAGARDVCALVDGEYVGGDLDTHREFTVATAALGHADHPVSRSGATPGEVVCVSGTFGRTAAAIRLFEAGEVDRANDLFRFTPRTATGAAVARRATAMMDSSDGLARSLHQLAAASRCGFAIEWDRVPVDESVVRVSAEEERAELAIHFGEDFELVFTIPADAIDEVRSVATAPISVIGDVEPGDAGITLDGAPLPDRGYTHGRRTS